MNLRRWSVLPLLLGAFALAPTGEAREPSKWLELPPTPALPAAAHTGYCEHDGARLWYAQFGRGPAVILLHGGLANSNYWGLQVRALMPHYRVIVMDSRGHGRSSMDERPLSYELMASDVEGVMDCLHVDAAKFVGWSDGGIIGLELAIAHPERVRSLFAFGANSNPDGTSDVSTSEVFRRYLERTGREYRSLSPTPDAYGEFQKRVLSMWATQPRLAAAQLGRIRIPVWIVDGDHEEAIKRSDTEFLAASIPAAGLLIQPEVSHFSFLQDPEQFNRDLLHFLGAGER
jgi:pimeloyl-ACP methyl ester carboxylesterase